MKKIIFIILLVTSLLCYINLAAQTIAEPPSNFDVPTAGTEENPFLISNLANLRWLSETPEYWGNIIYPQYPPPAVIITQQYHYKQTADIDATDTINWNDGNGYYSIGLPSWSLPNPHSRPFTGSYDGDNYKIENMFFGYHLNSLGLFNDTFSATLKNIKLENVILTDITFVHGSLAGYGYNPYGPYASTIYRCSVTHQRTDIVLLTSAGSYPTFISTYPSLSGQLFSVNQCFSDGMILRAEGEIINSYAIINEGNRYHGLGGERIPVPFPHNSFAGFRFFENSYLASTGPIDGRLAFGHDVYSIMGCVWDMETTSIPAAYDNQYINNRPPNPNIVHGLTTQEMKILGTYITREWDFENIWAINPDFNDGYPFLRWMHPDIEHYPSNSENHQRPTNLTLSYRVNGFVLKWDKPFTHSEVLGYNIYRDNVFLATTTAIDTFFIESQILPEDNYLYEIKTLYGQGIESDPTSILVSAPYPNVQPARYPSYYSEWRGGRQNFYRLGWVPPESNSVFLGYNVTVKRRVLPQIFYNTFTNENFIEVILEHDYSDTDRRFEVTAVYGGNVESPLVAVNFLHHSIMYPIFGQITYEINHNTVKVTWEPEDPFFPSPPEEINAYYHVYRNGEKLTENIYLTGNDSFFEDELFATGTYIYGITREYAHFYETEPATIEVPFVFVSEIGEETPTIETKLIGNYPNPFNPETTISFSISKKENVEIIIYNIRGQKVITLTNEIYDKGKHIVTWDGSDDKNQKASSGIYFYRLKTEDKTQIKKMVLLK